MIQHEDYFRTLLEERLGASVRTAQSWDRMAEEMERQWQEDLDYRQRVLERIDFTIGFLTDQGALDPQSTVLDVGSGLLRYAAALAERVKEVVATDLSIGMLQRGLRYSRGLGLKNIYVVSGDFLTIDLSEHGWANRFDLVFTSRMPEIKNWEMIEKMNTVSRRFCFNSGMIERKNSLKTAFYETCLEREPSSWQDAKRFYALWNLLWSRGYFPVTAYRQECYTKEERLEDAFLEGMWHEICRELPQLKMDSSDFADFARSQATEGMLRVTYQDQWAFLLWDQTKRSHRLPLG